MRCALLALGLPANASAHLLWKSGDMVDFSKPIADGVTLHLDTTRTSFPPNGAPDDDVHNALAYDSSGGGGFDPAYGGDGSGSALAQRRVAGSGGVVLDRAAQTRQWGDSSGGGSSDVRMARARCGGSITATTGTGGDQERRRRARRPEPRPLSSSESSLTKRRALLALRRFFGVGRGSGGGAGGSRGGMLSRFLERTTGPGDSDEELERRPLLGVGRVSSSASLLSPSSSSSSLRGGDRNERGANEIDGDAHNPHHQRSAILKLKRINAHLANERTFLAWVRCVGKMVTAAVLSLSLGSGTSASFALCFVAMGSVYLALCPYVVFVGASRYVVLLLLML